MKNTLIRVLIADDQPLYREGLAVLLAEVPEFEVMDIAKNGEFLVAMVDKYQPDVVLTDIQMPEMDGIQATRRITEKYPGVRVIALSMFDSDHHLMSMMEAGALGYLSKNASKDVVRQAIRAVHSGENYYCRDITARLAQLSATRRRPNTHVQFNDIELKIIQCICDQLSTKETAKRLFLSERTIEGYREKLFEKMDVKNIAGVSLYAVKNGLVNLF